MRIDKWAVVNFSARCSMPNLCKDLIRCGNMKGIVSIVLVNNGSLTNFFPTDITFHVVDHKRTLCNDRRDATVKAQSCSYQGR